MKNPAAGHSDQYSEIDTTRLRRGVVPLFLRWYLPVAALIVSATLLSAYFLVTLGFDRIALQDRLHLHVAKEALDEEVARPLQLLRSLAFSEPSVQRAIDGGGEAVSNLNETFYSLLSRHPDYAQIRWIGDDGMELLRLARTPDGEIVNTPRAKLQDKSHRYYVTDTLRLKRGQIFVSRLDLNIEHKQIEIPYHPMIRVGLRVFHSDGRSAGMFLLNISAKTMLDRFYQQRQGSDLVLLDKEGYWLKSTRAEDEWGFMFHKLETFGKRYPDAWQQIANTAEGQIELADGIWTWATIYPTPKQASSVQSIYWKAVTHIPPERLASLRQKAWIFGSLTAGLLLIGFGIAIWRLAMEYLTRVHVGGLLERKNNLLADTVRKLGEEIEARMRVQAGLEQSNLELQLSANVFGNITEGVLITTPDGTITTANPAFCMMMGYEQLELAGKNAALLNSEKNDAVHYREIQRCLDSEGVWKGEVWKRRKDGSAILIHENITAIRDKRGHCSHLVSVETDITESKHLEELIRYQAYHDALTGLPNRTLLMDRIRLHLVSAKRHQTGLAILFIDLDGFKGINDTFGHEVGDTVLVETASRLQRSVRESDTVARLGGDEFVALLNDVDGKGDASTVAAKILDRLTHPYELPNSQSGQLSASIGIALYPSDGGDAEKLLNAADEAMYLAKRAGKAGYAFVPHAS